MHSGLFGGLKKTKPPQTRPLPSAAELCGEPDSPVSPLRGATLPGKLSPPSPGTPPGMLPPVPPVPGPSPRPPVVPQRRDGTGGVTPKEEVNVLDDLDRQRYFHPELREMSQVGDDGVTR